MDTAAPSWSWPSDMHQQNGHDQYQGHEPADTPEQTPPEMTPEITPEPTPTQTRRRYYRPRTCRICLEEVLPTTELEDTLANRVFSSKARVRYVSEDPELGRLISPCLCKGSQKYVHEGCLQAWRSSAPTVDRNFYCCPTCGFRYRMERLRWSRWLSSTALRAWLTILVMVVSVFILGFIADPIINYLSDPMSSLTGLILYELDFDLDVAAPPLPVEDIAPDGWTGHFIKGFLSLGVLGFAKSMLAMSPVSWFNLRGRRRRGGRRGGGIDSVNWAVVVIGVLTFLFGTWKAVSHFSARALEKASDRVLDVQENEPDEDDEYDEDEATEESRKDR